MCYIKNKEDKDYTKTCSQVYNLLVNKYRNSARISNIWQMIADSLGLTKLEIFEPRYYQNGNFESYLIDRQIDWQNGKDVDFSEIYDAILTTGNFTGDEKLLMSSGNFEERLWAIYLAVTNPNLNLN